MLKMIEIRGKKATNIQSTLFLIFMDTKELLKCVKYYSFINSDDGWDEIDNLDFFIKYPDFFSATISSLRHQIIIDVAKLFDDDNSTVNIIKLFNQCEQSKRIGLKQLVYKYKKDYVGYKDEISDFIKIARDKIYAHTDFSFNANKIDKYSEYMLEDDMLTYIEKFLNWVLNICIELSKEYDGNIMNLRLTK